MAAAPANSAATFVQNSRAHIHNNKTNSDGCYSEKKAATASKAVAAVPEKLLSQETPGGILLCLSLLFHSGSLGKGQFVRPAI